MLIRNLASLFDHLGTASMAVPLLAIIILAIFRKDKFEIKHMIFFLYIFYISSIQLIIFYLTFHKINNLIFVSITIPIELFALTFILLKIFDHNALIKSSRLFLLITIIGILFYQKNEFPLILMISECIILIYICLDSFNHVNNKTFEYYLILGLLYYCSNTIILYGLLKYIPDFSRALYGLTNTALNYFYFRGILCLK